MSTTTDMQVVRDEAHNIVASQRETLTSSDLPASVALAYVDYATAINRANGAADQYAADLAELDAKRILLPPAGYGHLRREAHAAADTESKSAYRDAQKALATLQEELTTAALPKLDPSREALARQELATALGSGTGSVEERVVRVAQHGSRESVAALFSDFGTTLLASHGIDGPKADEALSNARNVAASMAAERGASTTERAAGSALASVGELSAAIGAAGTYVASVLGG